MIVEESFWTRVARQLFAPPWPEAEPPKVTRQALIEAELEEVRKGLKQSLAHLDLAEGLGE